VSVEVVNDDGLGFSKVGCSLADSYRFVSADVDASSSSLWELKMTLWCELAFDRLRFVKFDQVPFMIHILFGAFCIRACCPGRFVDTQRLVCLYIFIFFAFDF